MSSKTCSYCNCNYTNSNSSVWGYCSKKCAIEHLGRDGVANRETFQGKLGLGIMVVLFLLYLLGSCVPDAKAKTVNNRVLSASELNCLTSSIADNTQLALRETCAASDDE